MQSVTIWHFLLPPSSKVLTVKTAILPLVETHDGHRVEAVVLRRHGRNTSICVSSQVGCQMGCQFCATGTMGMIANLTGSEILEQIYRYGCVFDSPCFRS